MPTFPSMPDVAESHPVAVWKADDYLLVLVTDLKPLSARIIGEAAASGLHYDAALAVVDRGIDHLMTSRLKEASRSFLFASRKPACTSIAASLTI